MSTTGNYSTSVQHVFNNYMANEKYNKSAPYTGLGWKLNIQQTVLPSSKFGLTGDSAEKYPYVYTDGDGTDHYFIKETKDNKTTYKDEDGLKLELTLDKSSTNSYYTITNEKELNRILIKAEIYTVLLTQTEIQRFTLVILLTTLYYLFRMLQR